jgi:hypothetical protein
MVNLQWKIIDYRYNMAVNFLLVEKPFDTC